MKNFVYHAPVMLYVGCGCVSEQGAYIRSCGSKAFVLTSRFAPGYENLALADMLQVLDREDVDYRVSEAVEENPTVESVAALTAEIRDYAPEFLVAIGGGSALDSAKAANVLLGYAADIDPYAVFYDGPPAPTGTASSGVLPLLGIPTTAGSGSEVAGYAVLTRTDIRTKQRMNQLSFFDGAFLDARYISNSPQWLLDSGALDALAHGIESYVNIASNPYNRMLASFGFRLFSEFKDRLLSLSMEDTDYEKMLVAAAVQGMAVMQASTTLPHGMGYPLTHDKGVSHGLASCVTLGAYLNLLSDRKSVESIVKQCGFRDTEQLRGYIRAILARNDQFTVTRQEVERWTDEVYAVKQRLARHPEPVTREQIFKMYLYSLDAYLRL